MNVLNAAKQIKELNTYILVFVGCEGFGFPGVPSLDIVSLYFVNSPPVGSLQATVILFVVEETRFGATG